MRRVIVLALAAVCLSGVALAQGRTVRFVEKSPRDLLLQEALRVRVSLDYEVPTDLSEIIEFLNEAISQKLKIKHALRLDPRVIEVDNRAVSIKMDDVRVAKVLNLLLTDATTPDEEDAGNALGYVHWSDGGVLYITNQQRLRRLNRKRREFRFHDVRDLLAKYPMRGPDQNNGNNDNGNANGGGVNED